MLPTYTALFEAHRRLCVERGIRHTDHQLQDAQIAIARARLLAARLAGNREEDELPALLLALLLESDALLELADAFPVVAVRHLVAAQRNLALSLDLTDRVVLRRIRERERARRTDPERLQASLAEVRALVAARLRPLAG